MAVITLPAAEAMRRLAGFDALIDARSPSGYALDHIPGAQNWPSLDDDERRIVGTEHAMLSAFRRAQARRGVVARRIASHHEAHVADKPHDW